MIIKFTTTIRYPSEIRAGQARVTIVLYIHDTLSSAVCVKNIGNGTVWGYQTSKQNVFNL